MRNAGRRRLLLLVVAILLPVAMSGCGKTIGDTMEDATITTRVKTALLNDPDVLATRIDVNTSAGIVTLSGEVRSKAEADRAVEIARSVGGVKDVKTNLKVRSVASSQ